MLQKNIKNKKRRKKKCDVANRRKRISNATRVRFVTNIALVVVFFVGVVVYLVEIGNQATIGFTLSSLNRDRAVAVDLIEKSERRLREMQSISYITNKAKEMGMVEAQVIVHLKPTDSGVAVNR